MRTVYSYLDCAAHFSHWAERRGLDLARTDETLIERFRDEHLSRCDCGWPTRSERCDAGAACGIRSLRRRTLLTGRLAFILEIPCAHGPSRYTIKHSGGDHYSLHASFVDHRGACYTRFSRVVTFARMPQFFMDTIRWLRNLRRIPPTGDPSLPR